MVSVSLLPHAFSEVVPNRPVAVVDAAVATMRHIFRPHRLHRVDPGTACDLCKFLTYLENVMGRRLVFYAETAEELSFDEMWLSALFKAMERKDSLSYRFLLQQRLSRAQASEAHFLACRARSFLE